MLKFLKQYGTCIGPLNFPMQDQDAKDLERKLESGEYSPFKFQKSDSVESFTINKMEEVSVVTDGSVDKEGDVVDPKSIRWDTYQKNPLVPLNHQYHLPPVGKSLWQRNVGGFWKAKTEYFSRPDDYPANKVWLPTSIWHMIKNGGMKGKSIGGAVKWREVTKADIDVNPRLSTAKRISEAVEVFEYSVCPIGMNSNAVVTEIEKSALQLDDEILKDIFPEVWEEIKKQRDQYEKYPIIETFRTTKQLENDLKRQQADEIIKLKQSLPMIARNTLNRLLGRVQ